MQDYYDHGGVDGAEAVRRYRLAEAEAEVAGRRVPELDSRLVACSACVGFHDCSF